MPDTKRYSVTIASDMIPDRRTYVVDASEVAFAIGIAKVLYRNELDVPCHAVAHSRVR